MVLELTRGTDLVVSTITEVIGRKQLSISILVGIKNMHIMYTRQKNVENNYENENFGSNYPYALASHGVKLGRATQA